MAVTELDVQRDKLYAWEAKWGYWNKSVNPLSELRQYVHTACAYYGIPPPRVKSHGGRAYSWYQADENYAHTTTVRAGGKCRSVISFNRERGLNIPTALHEAAHAIASILFPWEMADHDPRFVGIYLWLLVKAKVAPRSALEASLTAAGVSWDPKTTPKHIKKTVG
jgi:hypothetical protein